jgi:hypothetical protein
MTDTNQANKSIETEKTKSEISFEWAEKWMPIIAMMFFVLLLGFYFGNFNSGFGDANAFGTFGDFVGGALNPLLGFLTVWLLIKSIRFQIDELRLTRNELTEANKLGLNSQQIQLELLKAQEKDLLVKVAIPKFTKCVDDTNRILKKTILEGMTINDLAQQTLNNADKFNEFMNNLPPIDKAILKENIFAAYMNIASVAATASELNTQGVKAVIYFENIFWANSSLQNLKHLFESTYHESVEALIERTNEIINTISGKQK